jgi:putative flippase GtrA
LALTVAEAMKPVLEFVRLDGLSEQTIAINVAKIGASLIAALWNFFMLRRFVFVTKEEAKTD